MLRSIVLFSQPPSLWWWLKVGRDALYSADRIAMHDPVPNSTHLSRHKFRWGRLDWLHQERCPQFWGDVDGAQTCYPWPQVDTLKNELSSMFYKTNNFWPKVVEWNCSPTISGSPIIEPQIRRGCLLPDIKRRSLSSLLDRIPRKKRALLLVSEWQSSITVGDTIGNCGWCQRSMISVVTFV